MDSMLTLFLRSPLLFSAAVAVFYYIPLYGRVMHLMDGSTLFCIFIHLLVDIFIVFTLGCWEQCCYEYWYTTLYLNNCFKFFVYLGVELPKHMIIIFLYFWENAEVLHTLIALFYISTNKVGAPISVHFCQHFLSLLLIFPMSILCALLRRKS